MTEREVKRRTVFYIIITAILVGATTGIVSYTLQIAYINSVVASLGINQTTIIANVTQEDLVKEIVNNVQGSVVHIRSTKYVKDIFLRDVPVEGDGTGFIISHDGYIATNNHVVSGANDVTVILPSGREYEAKIIGTDPITDLAVVKIEETGLIQVTLGDSDKLSPGQFVIAIGTPFNLEKSVTFGVVSAINRTLETQEGYEINGAIQTDAAINPGNSGGPLIDMRGRVVGINTAILSTTGGSQGIGFAIPINTLDKIVSELIEKGKVTRAWLGITGSDLNENLAKAFNISETEGAIVITVVPNGPAGKAGLKGTIQQDGKIVQFGDVIVEIAGKKVTGIADLVKIVESMESETRVLVRFIRNGERTQLPITLGERPDNL